MKTKQLVAAQLVLVILTIVIGAMLNKNVSESVRMAHKAFSAFTILTSFGVLIWGLRSKVSTIQTIFAVLTLVFICAAAVGGKQAKTDYDKGLMMMRIAAVMGLASTTGTLVVSKKES